MKNFIKITILAVVIIIGVWLIFSNRAIEPDFQEETESFSEEKVVLIIDDGEARPKTFEEKLTKGMTAFALLEKSGLTLKTKQYDIGIFVEAIGDKENGQDGKYWLYYVNGEMPQLAVDKKELKTGDKVEFKFEGSPF